MAFGIFTLKVAGALGLIGGVLLLCAAALFVGAERMAFSMYYDGKRDA